jgi:hypothetical protein
MGFCSARSSVSYGKARGLALSLGLSLLWDAFMEIREYTTDQAAFNVNVKLPCAYSNSEA